MQWRWEVLIMGHLAYMRRGGETSLIGCCRVVVLRVRNNHADPDWSSPSSIVCAGGGASTVSIARRTVYCDRAIASDAPGPTCSAPLYGEVNSGMPAQPCSERSHCLCSVLMTEEVRTVSTSSIRSVPSTRTPGEALFPRMTRARPTAFLRQQLPCTLGYFGYFGHEVDGHGHAVVLHGLMQLPRKQCW